MVRRSFGLRVERLGLGIEGIWGIEGIGVYMVRLRKEPGAVIAK